MLRVHRGRAAGETTNSCEATAPTDQRTKEGVLPPSPQEAAGVALQHEPPHHLL